MDPSRGGWPRIESTERVDTDSRGRVETRRSWCPVLANETGGRARNVRYEYIPGEGKNFDLKLVGEYEPDKLMPPGAEQRCPVLPSAES